MGTLRSRAATKLSHSVLVLVILNSSLLEGKKVKEAPAEDHNYQTAQSTDTAISGSYGVGDTLNAESSSANNGGVSSFKKYDKYGKYETGESSVSDPVHSGAAQAQYPETVMGYYSPYSGYTEGQSSNAYSYPYDYYYNSNNNDNSFYHKMGGASSSSKYPYSTDSYYKRNQKQRSREAYNRADEPEPYLPAAGAPQQQPPHYAYSDNMYSLDEPTPGPGQMNPMGPGSGQMNPMGPGPGQMKPMGPGPEPSSLGPTYSQGPPMYSPGPMYPPPSWPGPMQEPPTGLSSLGSSLFSGISSMFGASSGPPPMYAPMYAPMNGGPQYEFGEMPMESAHRSHYGGGGGGGYGWGGWGYNKGHYGKNYHTKIEKKIQYVPASYTKAIDNGIGLLGLLSLLSLLQANMLNFGTTTNSTRIVSFGLTGVSTGRKKRSAIEKDLIHEGEFSRAQANMTNFVTITNNTRIVSDDLTGVSTGRKKRSAIENDVTHEGGFAKAQAIAIQVLPALNVIAKVRQGSIPIECLYQEVCNVNRVLVTELALTGRHVGTVLSSGINRLIKSGNASPILEEKLRRAGLAGRNMKKCHQEYPTCPALQHGGAASVPLLIQPDKINLDMFENVNMSVIKNAQKKSQSILRYNKAAATNRAF